MRRELRFIVLKKTKTIKKKRNSNQRHQLLPSYFKNLSWWSGRDIEPWPPAQDACAKPMVIILEKCVLTILELNWNQCLGHKKTTLNICHHMITSSTQLQIMSFHVVERTRTSIKCQKTKSARAKRAKILFFIVKYANLWGFLLPSSSWLLKLPIHSDSTDDT